MKTGIFFRLSDLIAITATPLLLRYSLLKPLGASTSLTNFQFSLFVLAIFCLALAGQLIIDLMELPEVAAKSTPQPGFLSFLSEKTAYRLFFTLSIIGVGLGFYLANNIEKPVFASLFIGVSAAFYFYVTSLRSFAVVGNLLLAALVTLLILGTGIFELLPAITPENRPLQTATFSILLKYAGLAFLLTWLRAMLGNQLEVNRDYRNGRQTLPVILGRSRTNKFIFAVNFLLIIAIIYAITTYLYSYPWLALYAIVFILAPLLLLMIKSIYAKTSKDFKRLFFLVQFTQFFGLIGLPVFQIIFLFP